MHQGTLESISIPYGQQDIIMLYEVLEHQPCPEDVLLRCHDLLAEGGILAVCVPNDFNPLQLAAQGKLGLSPWWLAPPQHLYYWTPKTLQLCLRRTGFAILDCRGTFPMEKFLLDGRGYVGNDAVGRACHVERMAYELGAVHTGKWPQVEQEYRMNLTQRIGRELVFLSRKLA
jgi:SAM-dependent methyltransferase